MKHVLLSEIISRTSFEEARDIVQEVYLSAIISRKSLSDEGKLKFGDWAKGSASFSKYHKDDDFITLCGTGEGKPYSIH